VQPQIPLRRARESEKEMTNVNERPADARDMFAAHTMIRREFGLMPGLVRATPAGDTPRITVIVDHIALMGGFLNGHHASEDKHIWPHLLQRCPGQCAPIVAVMEEQHDAIHSGLLEVGQAALAWSGRASAGTRDALADAIDGLLPVAAEHLALEEEQVVPLIEKYLTQAEYAAVAQEQGADTPPDKLPTLFGMFMYETEPDIVDLVVAEMPAEVQPVIKDLGAAAYANYAQQLYGTATPARVTG
jgi:hemerythrin-like domain-containing protein